MDPERFDLLTRRLVSTTSRRTVLQGLTGGITGTVLAALGRGDTEAARSSIPLGGSCYRKSQCINEHVSRGRAALNSKLQVVYCADNGFTYDGDYNCCRYDGGSCTIDEHCCGYRSCDNRSCRSRRRRRRTRRLR